MIDFCLVNWCNYDLLDKQLKALSVFKDKRVLVVDNTPDNLKKPYDRKDEFDIWVERAHGAWEFDGSSHGQAVNQIISHTTSDIVCVMDTDFFITYKDCEKYINKIFEDGYKMVGTEWYTCSWSNTPSPECTEWWKVRFPETFKDNIPCVFCCFMKREIAQSINFEISSATVDANRHTNGLVFVGHNLYPYCKENKTKYKTWLADREKSEDWNGGPASPNHLKAYFVDSDVRTIHPYHSSALEIGYHELGGSRVT